MTTPSEALAGLIRPIISIENRTAQEVFDIMCGRIEHSTALRSAPVPSVAEIARAIADPGKLVGHRKPNELVQCWEARAVLALLTPAETAPDPVGRDGFAIGDRVRKTKGSSQGRVVGYYRTSMTEAGICVESEREPGSVQIYPASAPAPVRSRRYRVEI